MTRAGRTGRPGVAWLSVLAIAALLVFGAGTSEAQRNGDRSGRSQDGGGARYKSGSGARSRSGGDARYRSGGERRSRNPGVRASRGERRYRDSGGYRSPGRDRVDYRRGDRPRAGGSGWSISRRSGLRDRGDSRRYRSGPGRVTVRHGGSGWYSGSYYRSNHWCPPGYYRPYVRFVVRPRSYWGLGFWTGDPYDYHPRVVERRTVVVEPSVEIQVENEPPPGCYYYDPFCEREWANLDEYTEHLDGEGHALTIEIIERDSGHRVRTLEFSGELWGVKP